MTLQQLTLADALPWLPSYPEDPDVAALGRLFWRLRAVARPEPGTTEDRQFRRNVEILRRHGWPIVARGNGFYELSFAPADLDKLEHDLRARALSTLYTLRQIRRIRERRTAA